MGTWTPFGAALVDSCSEKAATEPPAKKRRQCTCIHINLYTQHCFKNSFCFAVGKKKNGKENNPNERAATEPTAKKRQCKCIRTICIHSAVLDLSCCFVVGKNVKENAPKKAGKPPSGGNPPKKAKKPQSKF